MNALPRIWTYLAVATVALAAVFSVQCQMRPRQFVSHVEPVAYTGRESCQPCHQKVYESFIETGMGRSLYRPDPAKAIERFASDEVVFDPQLNLYYRAFWKEGSMWMEEFRLENEDTTHYRAEAVEYVVGSGHQTRSYLLEQDGWMYEMPLTWYVEKQIWDLSPGYADNNSRFDREIGETCLACHTGRIEYIPHTKNRYRRISLGIDCESCHGPGAAHIAAIEGGQLIDVGRETDYTIVNPAKLPLSAQFDVCQQCHLQGVNVYTPGQHASNFLPGKPLSEFWRVFLPDSGQQSQFGIASHAERLRQSRCFVASEGQLTCTTCHDPHKSLELEDPNIFNNQCQSCHQGNGKLHCSLDEEVQTGDCVGCHMPSGGTSDIPHVSFHDHFIRVVDKQSAPVEAMARYLRLMPAQGESASHSDKGVAWLAYFEQQEASPAFLDSAAIYLNGNDHGAAARLAYWQGRMAEAEKAIALALAADPGNAELTFLKGEILEAQGRPDAAFAVFDELARTHPEMLEAAFRREVTRYQAAPDDPVAIDASAAGFEALLRQKPWEVRFLTNLAFLRIRQNRQSDAERLLVQALQLDPDDAKALENMILLASIRGNSTLANSWLIRLEKAHPMHPGLDRIREGLRRGGN